MPEAPVRPWRVLMVHSRYAEEPSGENASFEQERSLLATHGHEVESWERDNGEIRTDTTPERLHAGLTAVWSRSAHAEVTARIRSFRPDVLHVQNVFAAVSGSVYDAARREGVPVVQALRNYRLTCVNGALFRDGRACTDCLGSKVPWRGTLHACHRSRVESAATAVAVGAQRQRLGAAGATLLAVSEHVRGRHVEAGFEPSSILVKPNLVLPDPGATPVAPGSPIAYLGRLDSRKGVDLLLEAARRTRVPIAIAGDGPLRPDVERLAETEEHVNFLGVLDRAGAAGLLASSLAVVVPSVWEEPFGRVVVEAAASGRGAIVSDQGGLPELVDEGTTGSIIRGGDVTALVAALERASTGLATEWGPAARARYERDWTAGAVLRGMDAAYRKALAGQ